MAAPYVAETQTARWTSETISQSFRDLGFQVRDWPLTQHLENQLPADSMFFSPEFSKLFGLQYKTLYHNGDDFWPLDREQHETMEKHRFIYYCCSELTDPAEHGVALHFARFYRGAFEFQSKLSYKWFVSGSNAYFRWGAFYRGLKKCTIGIKITSREQLDELLASVTGEARKREISQMREYFLVDFDRRVLWNRRDFLVQ